MEVIDYTTQDGRGQLQNLRRLLARAVTESRGNVAKVNWLNNTLTGVAAAVTADTPWARGSTDSDTTSNNTVPLLIAALTRAASESSTYGGDYKTQLLQDITDAQAILTA